VALTGGEESHSPGFGFSIRGVTTFADFKMTSRHDWQTPFDRLLRFNAPARITSSEGHPRKPQVYAIPKRLRSVGDRNWVCGCRKSLWLICRTESALVREIPNDDDSRSPWQIHGLFLPAQASVDNVERLDPDLGIGMLHQSTHDIPLALS
jgi:hypothetical protein